MHIVDIAEFYSDQGGGVRSYIRQKLVHGAAAGHRITIVAPGRENRSELRDGGEIIWVKAPVIPVDTRYHLFARSQGVNDVLAALKPDVVEGSSPWRGGWIAGRWQDAAVRALFMHADPVASYPHLLLGGMMAPDRIDALFARFWRYLARLADNFDTTVVGGDWLGARFAAHGLPRLHTVGLGIDKTRFSTGLRSEACRAELLALCGLGPEGRVLVSVGRMHPEKRLSCLIDAVVLANRTRPVGLVIIGDGPYRRVIERKAAGHPMVHIKGQMNTPSQLGCYLASADALIHGGASETFGLAVSEALCSGTPIIVPDRGGARAAAAQPYAEVYATGDASACADAILRLLARDRAELSRHAVAAAGQIPTMAEHFATLFAHYAAVRVASQQS